MLDFADYKIGDLVKYTPVLGAPGGGLGVVIESPASGRHRYHKVFMFGGCLENAIIEIIFLKWWNRID